MIKIKNYPGMKENAIDYLERAGVHDNASFAALLDDNSKREKIQRNLGIAKDLFDAWCLTARELHHAASGRTGYIADAPTAIMPTEEYRRWVDDHVSRKISNRLWTVLSIIGVAGVFAILTFINWAGNLKIDNRFVVTDANLEKRIFTAKKDIEKKLGTFKTDLDTRTENMVIAKVATSLYEQAELAKKITDKANIAVDAEFDKKENKDKIEALAIHSIERILPGQTKTAIDNYLTGNKITELVKASLAIDQQQKIIIGAAVNAISTDQGLDAVIASLVHQLGAVVEDPQKNYDSARRINALQLLSIFCRDKKKLRKHMADIILCKDKREHDLRIKALKWYPLTSDPKVDDRFMAQVLENITNTSVSEDLHEPYARFFGKFSGTAHADCLMQWLQNNAAHKMAACVLDGLVRMKGEKPVEALVSLAIDRKSERLRELGLNGLSELAPRLPLNTEFRRRQMLRLWRYIKSAVADYDAINDSRIGPDTINHLQQLCAAIKNDDREKVSRMQTESQALPYPKLHRFYRYLLSSNDWSLPQTLFPTSIKLQNAIKDDSSGIRKNPFSGAWIKLIRIVDWHPLVTSSLWPEKTDDTSARSLLDFLISTWVQRIEDHEDIESDPIKQNLQTLISTLIKIDHALYSREIVAAMKLSLRHCDNSEKTLFLKEFTNLYRGTIDSKTKQDFKARGVLLLALNAAVRNRELDPVTIQLLTKFSENLKNYSDVTKSLTGFFRRYGRWIEGLGHRQKAIDTYSLIINCQPGNGDSYLRRSLLYLHDNRLPEAGRDLETALKLDEKMTVPISLQYVLRGSESAAKVAVEASAKDLKDSRSKAGALENLGLFYIRNHNWPDAFEWTEKIYQIDDRAPWNHMVRAISAARLGHAKEEAAAYKKWLSMGSKRQSVDKLKKYIGKEMDQYLNNRKTSKPSQG